MKKSIVFSIVLCGCFLLLASGCATRRVQSVDPRVTLSASMARHIAVNTMAVKKNDGGLLEGHVNISNRTSKIRQLEYRVEWTTTGGYTIPSIAEKWLPFSLAGYDSHTIRVTAPSPEATTPKILIREKGSPTVGAIINPSAL